MRKHLNNPWVVAVLVLAALFVVVRALVGTGDVVLPVPGDPVASPEPQAPAGEAPRAPASIAEVLKALVAPSEVRNPFAPILRTGPEEPTEAVVAAVPEVVERLHLSASWVQGSTVLLLVNGRVAAPGEMVGHCEIERADVTGAWIVHGGGRVFLPVGQVLKIRLTPSVSATLSAP